MRSVWLSFIIVLGAALFLCVPFWCVPADALAQGRRGAAELEQARAQLDSARASEVEAGLTALGVLGRSSAVEVIAARIRRGLPPPLLATAVETLALLGHASAGPVLFELTAHRRPEIRLRAIQAIVATRPRGAARALQRGLSDLDGTVRGAAAEGLGALEAREALDTLFLAMDRGVPQAGMAIAHLADAAAVERFLGYVGERPFDVIGAPLSEMLLRDDLAQSAKLAIVHRIAELATAGARELLVAFVEALDENDRSRARRAAEDAIGSMAQ